MLTHHIYFLCQSVYYYCTVTVLLCMYVGKQCTNLQELEEEAYINTRGLHSIVRRARVTVSMQQLFMLHHTQLTIGCRMHAHSLASLSSADSVANLSR